MLALAVESIFLNLYITPSRVVLAMRILTLPAETVINIPGQSLNPVPKLFLPVSNSLLEPVA